MPLEGNLKSLNLVAVLQLISNEKMSGLLHVRCKAEAVCIGFVEGMISGAFYEKGGRQERIENYLVKSGMVSKENFANITRLQASTHQPIINLLIENNYLKQDEVEMIIKFKIQEVLDEVFVWTEGDFKFEENKTIYPKSIIKIKLNTEVVILEGMRRIDEWPRIIKAIPSPELVFKIKEKPDIKIELTAEEKRVYDLVNGKRTVQEIVEDSALGRFRTYSALFHLCSTGQIETFYIKPAVKEGFGLKFSLKFLLIPIEILLLLVYLIAIGGIGFFIRQQKLVRFNPVRLKSFNYLKADQSEIFYLLNNRLPTADELRENFD